MNEDFLNKERNTFEIISAFLGKIFCFISYVLYTLNKFFYMRIFIFLTIFSLLLMFSTEIFILMKRGFSFFKKFKINNKYLFIFTLLEIILVFYFSNIIFIDWNKIPVNKDYFSFIIIGEIGLDFYFRLKNKK